jgi:hypothetical protein
LLDHALGVLSRSVGFESGWVGRSPDDPDTWVLGIRWRDAGSLRHGLGGYEAKLALGPLQTYSTGDDIVVEVLLDADAEGLKRAASHRADDADRSGPGPRYP